MKASTWFEAQGRSAASRGLPLNHGRSMRIRWPQWARRAWARGWLEQHPLNKEAASRPAASCSPGSQASCSVLPGLAWRRM